MVFFRADVLEEFSAPNAATTSGAEPQPSPNAAAPAVTPAPNTNDNHEQVGGEGGSGGNGGSGGGGGASSSSTAADDDEFAKELEAGMADLLGELEDSVSVGFTLPFFFVIPISPVP